MSVEIRLTLLDLGARSTDSRLDSGSAAQGAAAPRSSTKTFGP